MLRLVVVGVFLVLAVPVNAQDPTPTPAPTPTDSEQFAALIEMQRDTNHFLIFIAGAFLFLIAVRAVHP